MASPIRDLAVFAAAGAFSLCTHVLAQDAPPEAEPRGEATPVLTEQSPSSELPKAEDLFELYIKNIGGHDKVFAQENRRITGVFDGAPFKFAARLTTWLEAPDKLRTKIAEPAGRVIEIGYDGEQAWRRIDGGKVVVLDGTQADSLRDAADFYGQANYKDRYVSTQTVGVGELLERTVYIVKAVWPSGTTEHVLFDRESGLYVGVQYRVPVGEGEFRDILTIVDAYKDFEGVKYPTRITQMTSDGEIQAVYDYRDVSVDVDDGFDDYAPPSDG